MSAQASFMPWSLGRQVPQARCGGRFATTRGHCCYHSESCCEKTQWVSGLQSPLPMPWCLKELVAKAGSLPAIPASEHGSAGRPEGTLLLESLTLKHGIQYRREGRMLGPQEDGRSIPNDYDPYRPQHLMVPETLKHPQQQIWWRPQGPVFNEAQ